MTDEAWQLPPQPEVPQPAPELHPYPTLRERLKKIFAPLAGVGAFLAKFGAVLVKLKYVVFLGSAAVSVLAYAQLWGWRFGLGVVILLLIHELGHVIALRARGIRASGLVFVPLLGAFTSWRPTERNPYQEGETAIAGPVIGTVGALVFAYVAHLEGSDLLRALAFLGLFINLINLAPVPMLDGGRLTYLLHPAIWIVAIGALIGWEFYHPGVVPLLLVVLAGYQFYEQVRDHDGEYAAIRASVTAAQRSRISAVYLITVAAIVLGLHATYLHRHLQ